MVTDQERIKIRGMRRKGHTYREIIERIGRPIPKSTLSYICKEEILPRSYFLKIKKINHFHLIKAREKAAQASRAAFTNKVQLIKKQNQRLSKLSKREAKIALAFLYLGEGSKRQGYRGLRLGSSNPLIVNTYINLLNFCYGIERSKLKCRISYRSDQDLEKLQKYWAKITRIPVSNFYKTIPDPRTVGKPTINSGYKGVCVLSCAGTDIQLELQVITDIISDGLGH